MRLESDFSQAQCGTAKNLRSSPSPGRLKCWSSSTFKKKLEGECENEPKNYEKSEEWKKTLKWAKKFSKGQEVIRLEENVRLAKRVSVLAPLAPVFSSHFISGACPTEPSRHSFPMLNVLNCYKSLKLRQIIHHDFIRAREIFISQTSLQIARRAMNRIPEFPHAFLQPAFQIKETFWIELQ